MFHTVAKCQWFFQDESARSWKPLQNELQKIGLGRVIFENTGNIGKSYRKHDEIGTPVCITVDFQTLEDDSVTIRDRDSMEQKRLDIDSLNNYLINLINHWYWNI